MLITLYLAARARTVAACRAVWHRRWSLAYGLAYGIGIDAAFAAGFALALGATVWFLVLSSVTVFVHFAFILQNGRPWPRVRRVRA